MRPVIGNRCENWKIKQKDRVALEVFEMMVLRRIYDEWEVQKNKRRSDETIQRTIRYWYGKNEKNEMTKIDGEDGR